MDTSLARRLAGSPLGALLIAAFLLVGALFVTMLIATKLSGPGPAVAYVPVAPASVPAKAESVELKPEEDSTAAAQAAYWGTKDQPADPKVLQEIEQKLQPIQVTAEKLHADFEANPFKARERYDEDQTRMLQVSAAVQRIESDPITGSPVVLLWSGNQYSPVRAELRKTRPMIEAAKAMSKGDRIKLTCVHAREFASMVYLTGCEPT